MDVRQAPGIVSARGFRRIDVACGALWVADGLEKAACAAGLDRVEGWRSRLAGTTDRGGRGGFARVTLAGGPEVVLKSMRRGGALAFLWRDRFIGRRRLQANLHLPGRARAAGVATPAAVALLEVPGPVGFYRGWLAIEDVAGSESLLESCRRMSLTQEALDAALAAVRRMHEAGFDHRDLNLGNLLVREGRGGFEGFVVDLDRGRLHDQPLPAGLRRAALLRLERSYLKSFGEGGVLAPRPGERLASAYVDGDQRLAREIGGRSMLDRLVLVIHRLGWRHRRSRRRPPSEDSR